VYATGAVQFHRGRHKKARTDQSISVTANAVRGEEDIRIWRKYAAGRD
jgi:hypothetical protein